MGGTGRLAGLVALSTTSGRCNGSRPLMVLGAGAVLGVGAEGLWVRGLPAGRRASRTLPHMPQ
ncbi:MAG: hypothetical protein WB566_20480 [Terriglobales bacterium]